jgi:hypothetical protein
MMVVLLRMDPPQNGTLRPGETRPTYETGLICSMKYTITCQGQTWKNTKSLHNLNLIYFSYTGLFLGFTKEIAGKIKKFTQI